MAEQQEPGEPSIKAEEHDGSVADDVNVSADIEGPTIDDDVDGEGVSAKLSGLLFQ